jgi:GT2 family glycosyltransferase
MGTLMPSDSVTIGIVVFNTHLDVFERTIKSCKDFCANCLLVILCNSDNSNYQSKIAGLCQLYKAECISNAPNRGFGAGHNTIVNQYPSEWYVCCNPDICFTEDCISKMIAFASKTADSVQVSPKILSPSGAIQPLSRRHLTLSSWLHRQAWRLFPRLFRPYELRFNYDKTQPIEFVTGCFFMIRAQLFFKLGGFDESFFLYAEDADFSRRAVSLGTNYYFADSSVVHEWSTKWRSDWRAVRNEVRSLARLFAKQWLNGIRLLK